MKFFKEIKEAFGREDDHRGLRQELAHETNNIAININGKTWKVIPGKGYADSKEEWAYLNGMKSWAEKKSAATGKKWTVSLTGANVSEKKVVAEPALLENEDDSPMYGAIIHRIMVAHPDLLSKYGPEKIMMAAQEEAEWVGDVEEIGSSDVSISVKRVMQALQEQNPTESVVEMDSQGYKGTRDDYEDDAGKKAYYGKVAKPDDVVKKGVDALQNAFNYKKDDWSDEFERRMKKGVVEAENPKDVISVDVPLFIRLMEYAREDAKTDMDLHDVAENATRLSASGNTLTMDNYDAIIPSKDVGEPAVPASEEPAVTEATGHQGYDNMLAVMQAVEAGKDATFNLGGEPVTLEYPEARFLAGKYKAFLKTGRQEEFLKYMNDPVMFDRLMLQLRQLIDKQKNFRGSVPGERGVEESIVEDASMDIVSKIKALLSQGAEVDSKSLGAMGHIYRAEGNNLGLKRLNKPYSKTRYSWYITPERAQGLEIVKAGPNRYVLKDTDAAWGDEQKSLDLPMPEAAQSPYAIGMAAAKKKYGYGDKPAHDLPKKVIKKAHEIGDKIKADESLNASEYYCNVDRCVKPIPEGYKKLASGYITRK